MFVVMIFIHTIESLCLITLLLDSSCIFSVFFSQATELNKHNFCLAGMFFLKEYFVLVMTKLNIKNGSNRGVHGLGRMGSSRIGTSKIHKKLWSKSDLTHLIFFKTQLDPTRLH